MGTRRQGRWTQVRGRKVEKVRDSPRHGDPSDHATLPGVRWPQLGSLWGAGRELEREFSDILMTLFKLPDSFLN